MSSKNKEIARINTLIKKDRADVEENFKELFLNDISVVINEYFEIKDNIKVFFNRNSSELEVSVCFSSQGVKRFKNIINYIIKKNYGQ